MKDRPLLYIVDGSGYIYRAYFAIRTLSTSSGEPTNATYGFANMMRKVLETEQPTHIAITFDPKGGSFRNKLYPPYKQNRSAPPEDLPPQIPRIRQVAETFNFPIYECPGYEADDAIATLTDFAVEKGFDVRLITGDKDLMQLVDDRVSVWEPMREQRFDVAGVVEKFGLPPNKIADMLALAGDTSDNIPGVKGVGPKTAVKLLLEHGDFDGVLQAAHDGKIKGKICQKIVDSTDDARISRKLVALDHQVPLELNAADFEYKGPDHAAQQALFTELEFTRLIDRGPSAAAEAPKRAAPTQTFDTEAYRVIVGPQALQALAQELGKAPMISIALETDTEHLVDLTVYGIAIATGKNDVDYIPFTGASGHAPDVVFGALKAVLEDPNVGKCGTATKLLSGLCARHEIRLAGVKTDLGIASYLVDPEAGRGGPSGIAHGCDDGPHGARDLARIFFDHEPLVRSALLGRGKDRKKFFETPFEKQAALVGEAADICWRLRETLEALLTEGELTALATDVELPLSQVLAGIEMCGVPIDLELLEKLRTTFTQMITDLEERCYEAAGQRFKLGSTPQLRKVLFEDLGLKVIKRTKTGPSTDHSVLEELADLHPLPRAIVEYRQITKLQSTYVEALPRLVSPATGRVHTILNQVVAATGRLSSIDPNLQNIPIRTEIGRQLRSAFIAPPGFKMISVDYSQVELRVLGHFTEEPILVQAFADGADVHTRTASILFEVTADAVTPEQRSQAKAVNFGVLYGMGPVRLARQLGIERRVASQFVKDYFARQPKVRTFIDDTLEYARAHGHVRTLLGRRRWVRDIASTNRGARAAAERTAINTPIQGTAADLIKLAMIRVRAELDEQFPAARMTLQVHDELLVEAPESEAADVARLVKATMEAVFPLRVPLVATAHIGDTWAEAH